MKHTELLISLTVCLLAINWSSQASASEVLELEAAKGNFKIPFFEADLPVPGGSAGKRFAPLDEFPRNSYQLASLIVAEESAVKTPEYTVMTADNFIPAEMFDDVAVSKTSDLNAFRRGKPGMGRGTNQQFWPGAYDIDPELGAPQKIVFQNSSARLHPMHIHGPFFRVLEHNGTSAVEPFTRDTVLVGPREAAVTGLVTERKGIWVAHCHILEHAEA